MKTNNKVSTELSIRRKLLSAQQIKSLELGPRIGSGETADVYHARGEEGARFAVKVGSERFSHVIRNEALSLGLVGGNGTPRLWGVGRSARDELLLVMDLVSGRVLSEWLDQDRSAGKLVEIAGAALKSAGRSLMRLHSVGWAHGDVKPENLIVGDDGLITLIDLGLATDSGELLGGTPRYIPQCALQGKPVSPLHADVYALSYTVAEILVPEIRLGKWTPALHEKLPQPFRDLLSPILRGDGSTGFPVKWLWSEAQRLGVFSEAHFQHREELRLEYLATRRHEFEFLQTSDDSSLLGEPKNWCDDYFSIHLCLRELFPNKEPTKRSDGLSDLNLHDRRRFLGRSVGPWASAWKLPICTDAELVGMLEVLGDEKNLSAVTEADLLLGLAEGRKELFSKKKSPREISNLDPVELALRLAVRPVPRELLEEIACRKSLPASLLIEAARHARLLGELSLANSLLAEIESPGAEIERAHVSSRMGNPPDLEALQARLSVRFGPERSDVAALRARRLIDEGDYESALQLTDGASRSAALLENRALSFLLLGRLREARSVLVEADRYFHTEEARVRLLGIRGMLHHASGAPEEATHAFSQAVAAASSSGAALEEATYATGLAASASDAGRLGEALSASERAEILFESLAKREQTARALLARASVLVALGANREASSVIARGTTLAEQSGDRRCLGYFYLARCDSDEGRVEDRQAWAKRARELLTHVNEVDRLRAETRLLLATGTLENGLDEIARSISHTEARLEWWRARARVLERISEHGGQATALFHAATTVISEVETIASEEKGPAALGSALVAAAHLGLRTGQAKKARALLMRARREATRFLRQVPRQYEEAARDLAWIQQASGQRFESGGELAQLSDVEGLLRALSQRGGFKGLLNQVLDMLLLWTGVERGLLLLRAPGDKLVVRAARNLEKRDLSSEQRALSFSMARRAMEEGRTVVAADAMHDAGNVHRSIHALNLRSVLAIPLRARGRIVGVAYLDDRVRRGAFGEKELSWANLIGTVAALAISDEKDRLELMRSARRARRAEQRLEEQLGHREAALEVAERELSRIRGPEQLRGDYSRIIGRSRPMTELLSLVDRVAQSDVPFVIYGESGTGKELIFRAVAESGLRKGAPIVAENCGAVPEALLESTLFGHQKGAFTGASRNQAGLFTLADGGTLFLDEIGEMSLPMQTKLLRVLQDGEVRPLGASRSGHVDVRLIVATHRDLKEMVAEGTFREDLYYRLNVVELRVPPLRQRPEDVPLLVAHFLKSHAAGDEPKISNATMARLCAYAWPGNVRQLENEIRRMLVLGGAELTAADLSPEILSSTSDQEDPQSLREKVDALERRLVTEALRESGGNRTKAAESLGLSRFGLQKMSQRLGIDVPKPARKSGRHRDRGVDES